MCIRDRIDPVLKDIMEIPSLKMVHISPWTDIEKAVSVANHDIILEIVLNPVDDVEKATSQEMKEKLRRIKAVSYTHLDVYKRQTMDHPMFLVIAGSKYRMHL